MEQIIVACGLSRKIATTVMMIYKHMKAIFCLPDGDIVFFDIVTGILQKDTLAPYLLIICFVYVL